MKNLITKLIKITLGLLGVAMVDSCMAKAEYGCPHADFEAKGVVTDENDTPIKGIRVAVRADYPNPDIPGPRDTVFTDEKGEYILLKDYCWNFDKLELKFEDVDGPENGGEFHKVTVEVPVFKVKEGDGNWYDGAYEAGANVTMLKK